MSYNNQPGYGQDAQKPKKEKVNEWVGVGIVRPRSGNDQDPIKFFPFQRGGGAIHITLACTEVFNDASGAAKTRTAYVPVNVLTNGGKLDIPLVQSIRAGMKIRVVGKIEPESYTSKKTGQKVTSLVVNAYYLEILQQQTFAPGQPAYGQQPYYGGQGYQPPMGGQPYYGPQPGQQMPGQPPMGGQPAMGYQPGYAPAPQGPYYGPQPGQPMTGQPPMGGQSAPGYQPAPAAPRTQFAPGQPPQGAAPAAQRQPLYQQPAAPGPALEDMPEEIAGPQNTIHL